jgi:hypothetical protein
MSFFCLWHDPEEDGRRCDDWCKEMKEKPRDSCTIIHREKEIDYGALRPTPGCDGPHVQLFGHGLGYHGIMDLVAGCAKQAIECDSASCSVEERGCRAISYYQIQEARENIQKMADESRRKIRVKVHQVWASPNDRHRGNIILEATPNEPGTNSRKPKITYDRCYFDDPEKERVCYLPGEAAQCVDRKKPTAESYQVCCISPESNPVTGYHMNLTTGKTCLNPPKCGILSSKNKSSNMKDTDGDGVPDNQDACPGTPKGEKVSKPGEKLEDGRPAPAASWGCPDGKQGKPPRASINDVVGAKCVGWGISLMNWFQGKTDALECSAPDGTKQNLCCMNPACGTYASAGHDGIFEPMETCQNSYKNIVRCSTSTDRKEVLPGEEITFKVSVDGRAPIPIETQITGGYIYTGNNAEGHSFPEEEAQKSFEKTFPVQPEWKTRPSGHIRVKAEWPSPMGGPSCKVDVTWIDCGMADLKFLPPLECRLDLNAKPMAANKQTRVTVTIPGAVPHDDREGWITISSVGEGLEETPLAKQSINPTDKSFQIPFVPRAEGLHQFIARVGIRNLTKECRKTVMVKPSPPAKPRSTGPREMKAHDPEADD